MTYRDSEQHLPEPIRLARSGEKPYRTVPKRPTKYFGAHGTLEGGYLSGLYIVEAPNLTTARTRLHLRTKQTGRGWYNESELREIKGEWAEVLRDTLDKIQQRMREYYADLGNGVFYVEV